MVCLALLDHRSSVESSTRVILPALSARQWRARFQEGRDRGFPAEEGQTARERNIKRTNYICVIALWERRRQWRRAETAEWNSSMKYSEFPRNSVGSTQHDLLNSVIKLPSGLKLPT